MTKYQKLYNEMIASHQVLFDNFRETHDQYKADPKKWKEKFNEEGSKVMEVLKDYENRLCGHSENNGYGKYSSTLADKWWSHIRSQFSRIDFVGVR